MIHYQGIIFYIVNWVKGVLMCRKYQSSYGTVWVKCTEEVILVELKTCQHSYCSAVNDLIKNQTSILILLQLWDGNDLKLRIVDTKWTSIKVVGQKIIFLNASFHMPCQKILICLIEKTTPKNHSLSLCFYVCPSMIHYCRFSCCCILSTCKKIGKHFFCTQ